MKELLDESILRLIAANREFRQISRSGQTHGFAIVRNVITLEH